MRLQKMFSGQKAAFMPYVCCGDPSAEFTLKLVEALVSNGADAIELGIPFSDPIADGKTIQGASTRSLENGMTPGKALEVIRKLREKGIEIPIVVMTYYNIVYARGIGNFLKSAKEAGADGLIVPDAPLEESEGLRKNCESNGLDLVYLVTPNCPDERLKLIAEKSKGFLYAVSVLGITGARSEVSQDALDLIKRGKTATELPLVIGFGVSTPEHAEQYAKAGARGVIVGSHLVNIYSKYLEGDKLDEEKALQEASEFTKRMKEALQRAAPE